MDEIGSVGAGLRWWYSRNVRQERHDHLCRVFAQAVAAGDFEAAEGWLQVLWFVEERQEGV